MSSESYVDMKLRINIDNFIEAIEDDLTFDELFYIVRRINARCDSNFTKRCYDYFKKEVE